MKVLIIGGSSLLGKALLETKPETTELVSTWFTNYIGGGIQLDVCSKSQVSYVIEKIKPQVVIHCAAIGSVDYAESHFTECHMVNVVGMANVLKAAGDALFVYISTNAVFDGTKPPYSEISECNPVNSYGRIKREAELKVITATQNWLIVRPFLLYGWPYPGGRTNWLVIILDKLKKREVVKLVDDTYWQPTLAQDCAAAIWRLIEPDIRCGIYNVAAPDRVTLYEFGLRIAEVWGFDPKLIQPISSKELKIAPRPKDTTYDLGKINSLGIQLRGIKEGLGSLK